MTVRILFNGDAAGDTLEVHDDDSIIFSSFGTGGLIEAFELKEILRELGIDTEYVDDFDFDAEDSDG